MHQGHFPPQRGGRVEDRPLKVPPRPFMADSSFLLLLNDIPRLGDRGSSITRRGRFCLGSSEQRAVSLGVGVLCGREVVTVHVN